MRVLETVVSLVAAYTHAVKAATVSCAGAEIVSISDTTMKMN